MERLDDSLFIKIQEEMFIDPPSPKAEIFVDIRDANNQTIFGIVYTRIIENLRLSEILNPQVYFRYLSL